MIENDLFIQARLADEQTCAEHGSAPLIIVTNASHSLEQWLATQLRDAAEAVENGRVELPLRGYIEIVKGRPLS